MPWSLLLLNEAENLMDDIWKNISKCVLHWGFWNFFIYSFQSFFRLILSILFGNIFAWIYLWSFFHDILKFLLLTLWIFFPDSGCTLDLLFFISKTKVLNNIFGNWRVIAKIYHTKWHRNEWLDLIDCLMILIWKKLWKEMTEHV